MRASRRKIAAGSEQSVASMIDLSPRKPPFYDREEDAGASSFGLERAISLPHPVFQRHQLLIKFYQFAELSSVNLSGRFRFRF